MTFSEDLSMKNPSSCIKTKFALKFLRALRRTKKGKNPTGSFPKERGDDRTKMAADASMASVVGRRRVWSRAILQRVRGQGGRRRSITSYGNFRRRRKESTSCCIIDKVNELRDLVPGCETMGFYSLLDETADYIKCLTTQVSVMKRVLELCST